MIRWSALQCAYGTAERVPELLRGAEEASADFGDVWNDLWSYLCHQGTVYSASYAAIPALTAMCLRQEARGYLAPLQLVGSILASNDGPVDPVTIRERYKSEVVQLRGLAERCVDRAADDTEFIYGLETVTAFEDGGVWSRNLSYLAEGEAPVDCDSCAENLLVHFEDLPATVTSWDGAQGPTTIKPAAALGPTEDRLIALAVTSNRPLVAAKLHHMFGRAICPACGVEFLMGDAFS